MQIITNFSASEDEQHHNNLIKVLMLLDIIPYNNESIKKYNKGPQIFIPGSYGFCDIGTAGDYYEIEKDNKE